MGQLLSEPELEVFEHLLSDYQLDFANLEVFRSSNFAVIAGPAGAGKDTLRNALVERSAEKYVPIISTTTRPARSGEVDGREYHFCSVEDIKTGLLDRRFFQAALVHKQQVSCLDSSEIRKLEPGQIGLSILVVQLEQQLQMLKSDLKTIFLIPPSLEILIERMQANRQLAPGELARRLEAAKSELSLAIEKPHYYCLVSDSISDVTDQADQYLRTRQWDDRANQKAREIIRDILNMLSF